MTLSDIEREYRNQITPEDFLILAAHTLDTTKESVMCEPDTEIESDAETNLRSLLDRRLRHEPVAYLTGHREFYGLDFHVTPDTLIPRPETEHLVEATIDEIRHTSNKHPTKHIAIIDIGTGSGAIIVSLACTVEKEQRVSFIASDLSKRAIEVAKENARTHTVANRITFLEGNLLEPITEDESFRRADTLLVAANLPYLSDERYASAPPDVREYEPASALRANRGGLALYDELLHTLAKEHERFPRPIIVAFEIDPDQADPIRTLVQKVFPEAKMNILPDLTGRPRIALFRTYPRSSYE